MTTPTNDSEDNLRSSQSSRGAAGANFQTTQWTEILAARGTSPAARAALSDLCANYYEPVVAFLRRDSLTDDLARELTHEFFAAVLEGNSFDHLERGYGRFRSYLLGALKHFLARRREHQSRQRRGGGAEHISIHEGTETSPGLPLPDPHTLSADLHFDQLWAMALLDRALAKLETEWREADFSPSFEHLKPWLTGDPNHGAQAQLSATLGTTASALKSAVHRLKLRFRQLVRSEISETLANPAHTDAEMQALFDALSRPTHTAPS
jgi:DNA-directed RNA polymerase specialized sigma24 family protein